MIAAAVVCPATPLLLRELSGARDAVPELRAAAQDAVSAALATAPERVAIVGGHDVAGSCPALVVDDLGFGTAPRRSDGARQRFGDQQPPYSVAVGRRLLDEAGWAGETTATTVGWHAAVEELESTADTLLAGDEGERVVVLVLADGSARRGATAPGYLDERALAYDDEVGRALAAGDAAALVALDRTLARELMVLGWSALVALGAAVNRTSARTSGVSDARVLYRDDPYGVMYTVAAWRFDTG